MDNRDSHSTPKGWSSLGRAVADCARCRALQVPTILFLLLPIGELRADPTPMADEAELPMALAVSLGSVEAYPPSEIVYSPANTASDARCSAIDACRDNACRVNAYEQYAGQPIGPDRWESAGPQFPWLTSQGCYDDWRVGPVLSTRVEGLFLYRTNVASEFLTNTLMIPPNGLQHVNRFEHAGGARAYVTSQNPDRFGMQVGYVGAADWNASAESQLGNETRLNSYESSLHAVELNFLPYPNPNSQLLAGARYVDFGEDYTQLTDRLNFDISNNNLATGLNDDVSALRINNRLFGCHVGLRQNLGSPQRRFSLETLVNGGPFCNLITRKEIDQTFVTVNLPDDPMTIPDESQQTEVRVGTTSRRRRATELAFFGEAAVTAVYRFYPGLSVRTGYQAIWISGAHLATDRFGETSSVVFHGLHCGIEYRR